MNTPDALRQALADTFLMARHAQAAHWNVTGEGFSAWHAFTGALYSDLDSAVDGLAERLRTLGELAPGTLGALVIPTTLVDADPGTDWQAAVAQLLAENELVVQSLEQAMGSVQGQRLRAQGLANYVAERLDQHAKWSWQLAAHVDADEAGEASAELGLGL